MVGVKVMDASGIGESVPRKTLQRQAATKGRQFSSKSLGGTPGTKRPECVCSKELEARAKSESVLHPLHHMKPSVKPKEQRTMQGRKLPGRSKQFGGTKKQEQPNHGAHLEISLSERGSKIEKQSSGKNANGGELPDLFKKEFIERLAEKAKQRPGYVQAKESFIQHPKSGNQTEASERVFGATQNCIESPKRVTKKLGFRTTESPMKIQPSLSQDNSNKASVHKKLSDSKWRSKSEPFDSGDRKQAWSSLMDFEETSKDFILTKFFQTPTKAKPPSYSYDGYSPEEETNPVDMYAAMKHMLATKTESSQKLENVPQQPATGDAILGGAIGDNANAGRDRGLRSAKQLPGDSAVLSSSCEAYLGRFVPNEIREHSSTTSLPRVGSTVSTKEVKSNLTTSSQKERKTKRTLQVKLPGTVELMTDEKMESPQELKGRDKLLMSLKMAAAVDQMHFVRALQDNGASQSESPIRSPTVNLERSASKKIHLARPPSAPTATKKANPSKAQDTDIVQGRRVPSGEARPRNRSAKVGNSRDGSQKFTHNLSPSGRSRASDGSPESDLQHGREIQKTKQMSRLNSANSSRSDDSSFSHGSDNQSSNVTIETESSSASSMVRTLMKNARLRNSLILPKNQPQFSFSQLPSPSSASSVSYSILSDSELKSAVRRTLSYANSSPNSSEDSESPVSGGQARASSKLETFRRSSSELRSSVGESEVLDGSNTGGSWAPAAEQNFLNNSLRVNVQPRPIATLSTCRPQSLPIRVELEHEQAIEKSCPQSISPDKISTLPSVKGSQGGDDSGSEVSGTEQPSPNSVLSFKGRTPFQEDNRLSPLEQKLQELHDRIHKSRADVRNQKKVNLAKIKAASANEIIEGTNFEIIQLSSPLSVVHDIEEPQVPVVPTEKVAKTPSPVLAIVIRDEKLAVDLSSAPPSDFWPALETLDIRSLSSWSEEQTGDMMYVRDVLMASGFGQDMSVITQWHSVMNPIDPFLFGKLEDFYKHGSEFQGSHFLSSPPNSQEDHLRLQKHIKMVSTQRRATEAMNRSNLFAVVNEILARRLTPYVARSRPWMRSLAGFLVRPCSNGSVLFEEIWLEIRSQIGRNGSMKMNKEELHQSLEDLISKELQNCTPLFPSRDVERTAERVGTELERRIFEDLLRDTIASLS